MQQTPAAAAGRLTVSRHVIGGRGDLLDQAGPQVLQAVVELDGFGHRDTVLRDLGRPVGLLNDYIASLHRAWARTHESCGQSSTAPWRLAGPYIAQQPDMQLEAAQQLFQVKCFGCLTSSAHSTDIIWLRL